LRNLTQSNRSFCSFSDLAKLSGAPEKFSKTFAFLDASWEGAPSLVSATILECCSRLDDAYREKAESMNIPLQQSPWFLDYESLYYFSTLMRRLETLADQTGLIGSLKTFYMLFRQAVQETRLAFSGEPLEGLQIMGMLETRNLDFKNIILLSANEDILPKGKSSHSFIPFEVKKKYGLQVHTDKDATYAYNFYRLLQRAENIYMIYNTQKGSIGSQEKSRFITQLQMELTEFNPRISFREEIVSMTPARDSVDHHISVEKTPEIMQRLQQMAAYGFSPSALNTYINCPLQFYLQKVARLDEADQVEETLEASTMGNVIHGALETLYKPYIQRTITAADITQMQQQAGQVLQQVFANAFEGGDISSGKNLLLTRVARRFTENFLETEKKFLENEAQPVTILQLESPLAAVVEVDAGDQTLQVGIRGMADRIDRVGQTIRVIDYKTGRVKQDELNVNDPETIIRDPKMSKTFQLICYSWLLRQAPGMTGDIESGIFSMRNLGAGLLTVKPGKNSGLEKDELADHFDALLRDLLTEIMDATLPFSQTEDSDHCKYCPFRQLCHRFPEN
jgi:ATP-dependent helicase/nuclease subunit B